MGSGEADGKQTIRVELFEPTQGNQTLMVELERFTDATEASYEVAAPVVSAVGVGRQQGIVVVRLEDGLQGEVVRRVGLLQVDQNDLVARVASATVELRLPLRCRTV